MACFIDFSNTTFYNQSQIYYGVIGVEQYNGSTLQQHTTLFKYLQQTTKFAVTNFGLQNQVGNIGGEVEGRLSAGFTISASDKRVYLGTELFASSNSIPYVFNYTPNAQFVVGSNSGSLRALPGNEIFEVFLYSRSVSDNEMNNLMSNMTYLYDKNGSFPALPIYAVYSVRRVLRQYTGPVVQFFRSNDNKYANLYTD